MDMKSFTVIGPKRWKLFLRAVLFMGVGVATIAAYTSTIPVHRKPLDQLLVFVLEGFACLTFAAGILALLGAVLGRPRLRIESDKIVYDALRAKLEASYRSLSPFAVVETASGTMGQKVKSVQALITGHEASKELIKRRFLSLPNDFNLELSELCALLNEARERCLAGTPPRSGFPLPRSVTDFIKPAAPGASISFKASSVRGSFSDAPWLTYSMLGVFILAYAAELVFAVNPSHDTTPSIPTLVALGGLNRTVMLSTHEWYRAITAIFLHGSPMHLLFNGIAFYFCGVVLEKLVGRVWFLAFFAVGGLAGSLMSFFVNDMDATCVGASGAIMALFAALFTSSFRLPEGPQRRRIQTESVRILIPSLLPLAEPNGVHVDLAAHLGGAFAGALVALLLLKFWRSSDHALPLHRFAAVAISLCGVGVVLGFALVALHYPDYVRRLSELAPEQAYDRAVDNKAAGTDLPQLLVTYPKDPRLHLLNASRFLRAHDVVNGRLQLEEALQLSENYRFIYGLKLSNQIRIVLAVVWDGSGAFAQAQTVAAPACAAKESDLPNQDSAQLLVKYHLCSSGRLGPPPH